MVQGLQVIPFRVLLEEMLGLKNRSYSSQLLASDSEFPPALSTARFFGDS